jgi:hypothetical protein
MQTATATASATAPLRLTAAQREAYARDGVVLFHDAIPANHVELLRNSASGAMARIDAEMDLKKTDVIGICRRGSRYFSIDPSAADPDLYDFIYSPLMEGVVRDLLGPTVHVFWEQYVIKGPETGMKFSWHQDSGYVSSDSPHPPYLTCWCALDDMSEENGTAYILPQSRLGIRSRVEHIQDPEINDLVGYFGTDPGDPAICRAGSMALFSSHTFHRSGWNRSPRLRRVYLIQYSAEHILRPDGTSWGRTECFLKDGVRIAERR